MSKIVRARRVRQPVLLTTRTALLRLAVTVVISAAAGCSSGSPGAAPSARGDAGEEPVEAGVSCAEPAPTFAEVQLLFGQSCVSCHAEGNDLDLTASVAYANLVGHPAPQAESCGGVLVVPGSPEASYLYMKLTSAHPCSGEQMPRTEFLPAPLPGCSQALVRDWIGAGAPP
jgi:hypothetical protein